MNASLRQGLAVLAVAAILAHMGLISLSHVKDYVAWPAGSLGLCIAAALCGALLALAEEKAILLMTVAAPVSAMLFGASWAAATWGLLGSQVPTAELFFSDLVLLYALQRSFLLGAPAIVFGLLGVLIVQLSLPRFLRR